uniref:Uncharacterized protein n=1 Tax=Oryza sativa subsp. japonica TaxID=39947 RepID=Q84NS3_ORYSJ|nr:hypothetical protein [Oryza sativa Japonica Group]
MRLDGKDTSLYCAYPRAHFTDSIGAAQGSGARDVKEGCVIKVDPALLPVSIFENGLIDFFSPIPCWSNR